MNGQSSIETVNINVDLDKINDALNDINENADIVFILHDFEVWNNSYHQDSQIFPKFVSSIWSDKHVFVFPTEIASTALIRSQFKPIAHQINKIVVGSEFYKKMFTKFDSKVDMPANKVKLISIPTFDTKQVSSDIIKAKANKQGKFIIHAGLLHPKKDYIELLRNMEFVLKKYTKSYFLLSLRQHPRISLPETQEIYNGIFDYVKNNDAFKGKIGIYYNEGDPNAYLQQLRVADLVVFPQDNSMDMYNGALVDCIAAGKAVVAPTTVFTEDLVKKAGILLYKYKDTRTFYDAVSIVLDNKPLREILENQNYELGRTLTYPKIAQQYINQIKRFKFN